MNLPLGTLLSITIKGETTVCRIVKVLGLHDYTLLLADGTHLNSWSRSIDHLEHQVPSVLVPLREIEDPTSYETGKPITEDKGNTWMLHCYYQRSENDEVESYWVRYRERYTTDSAHCIWFVTESPNGFLTEQEKQASLVG